MAKTLKTLASPLLKLRRQLISFTEADWGNCSRLRNLSFNWRLVMAPPAVLDYIVVHELAHLKEPSHSPKFWLLVRSFCPRFAQHRDWLRLNEDRLRLVNVNVVEKE